jgi:hypothetical protein
VKYIIERIGIFVMYTALVCMYTPSIAQEADYFSGTYLNQETGLKFKVTQKEQVYTCTLSLQDKTYEFQAAAILGILSGAYQVQGNSIPVTFTRLMNKFILMSEGYSIHMERDNTANQKTTNTHALTQSDTNNSQSDQSWLIPDEKVIPASGSPLKDPYGNYQLQLPKNWKLESSDSYITLKKDRSSAAINIYPHLFKSTDEAMADVKDISDPNSDTNLNVEAIKTKNDRHLVRMKGLMKGQPTYIEYACIFSPYGGGIFINLNLEQESLNNEIHGLVQSILATVQFLKPPSNPTIETLEKRLRGRKLVFLKTDSYSTQRTDLDLFNDGSYAYKNETSMMSTGYSTLSYAGNLSHSGRWKIAMKDNKPILLLCEKYAEFYAYEIQAAGESESSILLGGSRFFIQ